MSEKYSKKPAELSHLNDEEIDKLITSYYEGQKVSKLLLDFRIHTRPQKLVRLFPLLLHLDRACPYCNIPMFTVFGSREFFNYPPGESQIACRNCGHKYIGICKCKGCREKAEIQLKLKLQRNRNSILNEVYSTEISPVNFEDLSFIDKAYLGAVLRVGLSEDFSSISSIMSTRDDLTPSHTFSHEVYTHLYEKKIIIINPNSPLESFEDRYLVNHNYFYSVNWMLNLKSENKDSITIIDQILNPDIYSEEDIENALTLWRRVALEECLQYLIFDINSNFSINYSIGEKTVSVITDILKTFSTSQIFGIIKRKTEEALRFQNVKSINRRYAANSIIGNCQKLADRAIVNKWNLYNKYYRKKECPQTVIANFLYDRVLRIGNDGFYCAPDISVLKNVLMVTEVEDNNFSHKII